MDLNELLIFIKVVELQSFTTAGKSLGLQKSTISRKIAQLEERLGVRLLNRTTRKLSLTDVGQAHYQRCREILRELEEAELAVTRSQSEPSGILRVAMPTELGQLIMGRFMGEFIQRYPKIQIQAELSSRLVDIVGEGFDLAIRVNRMEDSSLVCRRLLNSPLRLYASAGYLESHGTPAHPTDLHSHKLMVIEKDSQLQQTWAFKHEDEEVHITARALLSANSMTCCREAMLTGLGIARLPMAYMKEQVQSGAAVPLLTEWEIEPATIWAVYSSRRLMPTKLRIFLDELVTFLENNKTEHFAASALMGIGNN
ncbi:LysR family transcriptional regulator [Pokkaliibacter sp. MBI-7]|uniref:LysR family transcriptional regulator n=1 Tax=Pokkaliibacter sp. MBI-7 TaxID=3040600 RepID=UPI00244757CA|nr:LysR family transcriptional regulator [Pokkaliibacter sp. MBI-7]MDH2436245.1 LysR family transcriptional regulator [Pokkaliibacter sp. MBI-7]